jgi:hypothetical protein
MKAWTKTHVDERCVSLGFANKHQLLHVEELLSVNGGYLLSGVSWMFILPSSINTLPRSIKVHLESIKVFSEVDKSYRTVCSRSSQLVDKPTPEVDKSKFMVDKHII